VNPYWLEEPSPSRPQTKLVGRAGVAILDRESPQLELLDPAGFAD
jgi:hypothetical protein